MFLNTLSPANGSKTPGKRRGRGIGSGLGKTAGKGHKGQKARAGGYHRVGFEGGQTPYQRKSPKFGFTSKLSFIRTEIRLAQLNKIQDNIITLDTLRANKLINSKIKQVKIIATGKIEKPITINCNEFFKVTKGAKLLIEACGGKVLTANQ